MTWTQTESGRAVELLAPAAEDIDFRRDIARGLARISRFNGQVGGGAYSVAQHSVIGAKVILRDTGNRVLATAFLLHDAHEALIGDITSPVKDALIRIAGREATSEGGDALGDCVERHVERAFRVLKDRIDAAIFPAAGLRYPLDATTREAVKDWDARMLETERKLFLGPCPRAWHWDDNPPRTIQWPERPSIWPWPDAADRWLEMLSTLCPHTSARAA